jgi:hypothetical protein
MPALVVGDYVAIPREVAECNRTVTMAADVFFVDGDCFFVDRVNTNQVHYGGVCWKSFQNQEQQYQQFGLLNTLTEDL